VFVIPSEARNLLSPAATHTDGNFDDGESFYYNAG
jgi:hypothetical protein